MRTSLAVLVAVAFTALAVSPAFSDSINFNNPRPVTPVNAGDGPGMQTMLNTAFSCTDCVDPIFGQQSTGVWGASNTLNPLVGAIFSFEFAGNASLNGLGLWSGTDTEALTERAIFNGAAMPGSIAALQWTGVDSGTITQLSGQGVNAGTFTGISVASFGFYLDGPGGKFYTVDQLNGGAAQSLAYVAPGAEGTNWMIAFEDTVGGDRDFNDAVIRVKHVSAIPEPEVYAMLAAGLGLMGFVARRRKQHGAVV